MRILLALALALLATPVAARAATTQALLLGAGLSIDAPCARHVAITPDPALHGMSAISATADHQEEIDRLVMHSHDKVEIRTRPDGCWQTPLHSEPTLDIVIRVPAAYPLAIDESGAGDYTIGAVGGPLSLDLSGAAKIAAAASGQLNIDISGSGDVSIAEAQGPAAIDISGHGHIAISQATLPSLSANLSGAGAVAIKAGTVGKLSVESSGVGSVEIGATVGDAQLDISGLGSIRIARLTGSLQKEVSGLGTVSVGR
jgi:hypothetical protein